MSKIGNLPALPHETLAALFGQSLLLTTDWTKPQLEALLAVARHLEAADRAGVSTAFFPDQLAWALFFDKSTRTKSAWAGAGARLGMSPVIVDGSSTQVEHGETAEETGAMLGMNSHALGVRHDLILGVGQSFMRSVKQGIDQYLDDRHEPRRVPVVNLQCDVDHPTQSLADLMWLLQHFKGSIAGKRIAMNWAYSPSYAKPLSVAQAIITLLPRFGANVVFAHPDGYQVMPERVEMARQMAKEGGGSFEVTHSMDDAFRGADVVYPKSWGPYDLMLERVAANQRGDKGALAEIEKQALARNAQQRDWICDERRMGLTAGGKALYMHPLPADIGDEVQPSVMRTYRLAVAEQAQKKMYVIMALLAIGKQPDLAGRLEQLGA
jgi:knotted carbamoyltransferase YgeW